MSHPSTRGRRSRFLIAGVALASGFLSACGGSIDIGSDVLWAARFEGRSFDEWTGTPGGGAGASSATGSVEVSGDQAHAGRFAAKLVVAAPAGAGAQGAVLSRKGDLPAGGYYSAWYYLPETAAVGQYWVIFKLRRRMVVDDPASEGELFDLGFKDANGELSLQLFDHRIDAVVPLRGGGRVVAVGVWFQIEVYYRNAPDASGALAVWFDGEPVLDLDSGATSPTPWIEWDVLNLADTLTPSTAALFVDDCALSRRRVGPAGRIGD